VVTPAPIDRLSSLDHAFLAIESGPLHMHVGAVAIFEGGSVLAEDGALDIATLRAAVAASLRSLPRFRERVRRFPLLGEIWASDPDFDLDYHVRHTAVPRPGRVEQLHALAGRVFSQRLDRERPLWELWLVEGLEHRRFAVIAKAHHAMLDGVAGMGLLASLFSLTPDALPPTGATTPRVHSSSRRDLAALLTARVQDLTALPTRLLELTTTARGQVRDAIAGGVEVVKIALGSLGERRPTPLNPDRIGPHRVFAGVTLSLEDLKRARRALGCTLNDVALAVVTGALRRFLEARAIDPGEVGALRALVPVSLRARGNGPAAGNRVAMLLAQLPIDEADPRQRIARIAAHTAALKRDSHEVEAAELVEELAELGPRSLMGLLFRVAQHLLPFHVVVTNVPGPTVPLYLGPAKLERLYPLVPLFARQSVGIALLSYDGALHVGLDADRGAVPDLGALASAIEDAAGEVVSLAS
jgi:WS/DGAT/MGAT family acyltransferase